MVCGGSLQQMKNLHRFESLHDERWSPPLPHGLSWIRALGVTGEVEHALFNVPFVTLFATPLYIMSNNDNIAGDVGKSS